MRPNIWECENHHIHLIHNGAEVEFENIYEFLDAMAAWQEFIIFHMTKFDLMPDEVWHAFAEANRN
jgi:hypothetical protein